MDEDEDEDETLLLATLEQLYRQQALINELFLAIGSRLQRRVRCHDARRG